MICPKCGARFDSANFCRTCGTPLLKEQGLPAAQPHSPPVRKGSGTIFSLFSPVSVDNRRRDLDGHTAVNLCGKLRIDLTARALQPGETRLSICSLAGTTRVVTPSNVAIKITGVSLAGHVELDGDGIGNSFVSLEEYTTPGYERAPQRIHIDVANLAGKIAIFSSRR
ncbi:MAG TPA: LiaF domain-containing protein [Blastocatellia bacterium]